MKEPTPPPSPESKVMKLPDGKIVVDGRLFNPQNPPMPTSVKATQSVQSREEELQGILGMAKLIGAFVQRELSNLDQDVAERQAQWREDNTAYQAWLSTQKKAPGPLLEKSGDAPAPSAPTLP